MRYFVILFSLLFSTTIYAGSFHDHVKKKNEISESERAENFINTVLKREEVEVIECFEILADIREYLIVAEEFELQGLAMLIKYRSEAIALLDELNDLPGFMNSLLDEHELLVRIKELLSNLADGFKKNQFALADCINLDEPFREKFLEAFKTWFFIRTHDSEKKLELVTELYKATFGRYVRAFIDEVDELKALPLDQIPVQMYKGRLTRIRKLLLKELSLMESYPTYELNFQMLIRQLKAHILYHESKGQKPLHEVKTTLNAIGELLKKVLADIPRQKIKLG